ncbi:MAG TPA: tannase/feruloyl esterase family alpha/beta hydrolase [Opitutaceae bacterium]|nr:tannase/feruloyl esterase family alpha/beta hydrolase [Opitutaceae bacterium]
MSSLTRTPFNVERVMKTGAAVVLCLSLFACSSGGGGDNPLSAAEACSQLSGFNIPGASMSLPTNGGAVTATELVAASGTAPTTIGEYCKVSGAIYPVDSSAPQIRFQVNLPTIWNNKSMMFGGGGYNGSIPAATGNAFLGPIDKPVPLGQGYATFASDSGHQANAGGSRDASFGLNDEAITNYVGDALKKTRDAAVFLINKRYGQAPARTYFHGQSTGGREAFAVIQRWPQDFDGAVSIYPAWNGASLDLQFGRLVRAFAAPGAYPNENKKKLLYDASIAACDGLDGIQDGLISNVSACNFKPETLRCAGGADTGDTCLSDPQIAAYNAYNTEIRLSYPLGSGETQYPGFNVFAGADTRGVLNLGTTPPVNSPGNPSILTQPYWGAFWEQWIRFFVTRDPGYNALTFDPENPGVYQQRVAFLTKIQDVNNTDFSAFRNKGGKLLIMHGTADALVSPRATDIFYQRMVTTMGAQNVSSFARYYVVPGQGHVFGAFATAWDSVKALEDWVERGVAPPAQIVSDTNAATRGRTRPLCEFPSWPKYGGTGDVNLAASFTCATQ